MQRVSHKKLQGVFFDLDGVLVDACEWHFEALNKALLEFNFAAITHEEHLERYNGLPTYVKLEMLNIERPLAEQINELKQKYTLQIIRKNKKIDQQKIELFEYLHKEKIRVICVTNSIRETAREMLSVTEQLNHIDLLITNEDVGKNKPSPDCYNLALQIMNFDGDRCIVVEDSPKGLQAAKSSRINYIWQVKNSKEVNLKNFMEFCDANL